MVCGLDGSTESRRALAAAVGLAERLDLRLVVAHVVPSDAGAGAADRLEELDAAANDADRRVLAGRPAERLAELADDERAELVVVGSRGQGASSASFLGSVSSELVGLASCPVLVVPPERPG